MQLFSFCRFVEKFSSFHQVICSVKEAAWGWALEVDSVKSVRRERVIFDWENL